MVHLAKYGAAQIIHEVGWKLRKEVTREAYLRDLDFAADICLPVYQWLGQDRAGKAMAITWVVTPNDHLLSVYELQGRV